MTQLSGVSRSHEAAQPVRQGLGSPKPLLPEPSLKLDTTPDFNVGAKSSQRNPSRPHAPAAKLASATLRPRSSEDTAAPSMAPSPVLPLLVNSRSNAVAAGETTLAQAAAVVPVAPTSADDADLFGTSTGIWPENMRQGGPTCAGPRGATARKKPAHRPMGEVMMLGAGLHEVVISSCPSQQPELKATSQSDVQNSPGFSGEERQEQCAAEDPAASSCQETAQNLISTARLASLPRTAKMSQQAKHTPSRASANATSRCSSGSQRIGSAKVQTRSRAFKLSSVARPEDSVEDLVQPVTGVQGEAEDSSALPADADGLQLMVQVSTQEVALQTDDAPVDWASLSAMDLEDCAVEQRILVVQRCNREQVNLSTWNAIPRPDPPLSAEMRYQGHVRSRFPGTIADSCRLASAASDQELPVPHLEALMMKLRGQAQ